MAQHPLTSYTNDSFWDTQTSGKSISNGGTGKTTSEMKTESTYTDAGWDFEIETENGTENHWDIDDKDALLNDGYPFLSWENGDTIAKHNSFIYVSTSGTNNGSIGLQSEPFASIQTAIDYSQDGDTILVQPATYTENINFNGKNIVLGSLFLTTQDTSYISSTIIDGNQNGSVVTFISGEDSTAQLCGFTLKNGNGTIVSGVQRFGGGIYCYNSSRPTISNCIISNNSAGGGSGGGISCWYASAIIENCIIRNNSNHGIANMFGAGVKVVNCLIHDNYGSDYGGGIKAGGGSIPALINCTITDNDSYHQTGSGIFAISGVDVVNSIVWNNVGTNLNLEEGATIITYSCIEGGHAGTGNIESDPLFIDPDNNNFHLSNYSPCIGAGLDTNIVPTTDSDGNPRPNPSDSNPDIGAYENSLIVPEDLIIEIRHLMVAPEQDSLHVIDHTPIISFSFYNNASGNLSSYQVQVSSFSNFAQNDKWDTQVVKSSDTNIIYNGNALVDGYTYYLRVKGSSNELWNLWSDWDTISFRMNSKPTIPTLISPKENITENTTSFIINACTDNELDTIMYKFYLYNDETQMSIIDSSQLIKNTTWVNSNILTENNTYWWRVKSFDGYEYSAFSSTKNFTYNIPPSEFLLLNPQNFSEINILNPVFSWTSSFDSDPGDSVTYSLTLDGPEIGINVYNVGSDTSYILLDSLYDNIVYHWKVIASNCNGVTRENTGGYQSFTVNMGNDNPTTAEPISPDSVIVLTLNPKFTWKASTDPDPNDSISYKMRVWNTTYRDSVVTDSNSCFANIPLSDNSEYAWDVVVTDKTTGMSQSGNAKFWTDLFPEAPAQFNTISPTNNEVMEEAIVDLLWQNTVDPDPMDYITYTLRYKSTHQDSIQWHEIDTDIDTSITLNLTLGQRYEWQVIAKDDDGFEILSDSSNFMTFDVGNVSGFAFMDLPQDFTLSQNYPNPWNPETRIKYGLPEQSDINLIIYNIMGRKIKEWNISNQNPGWHELVWNGTNNNGQSVSTGVYIYSLQAGDFIDTKKMVFMK